MFSTGCDKIKKKLKFTVTALQTLQPLLDKGCSCNTSVHVVTLSTSVVVARLDFLILKNRKAKKTLLGGGIIPTALIVKVNKNSRQDEPALLHERR